MLKHGRSQNRLTQHSESCHCYCEVSCAWNSGSTDIYACMLHLHIRDYEVPISKDTGIEDINGLMVYLRQWEKVWLLGCPVYLNKLSKESCLDGQGMGKSLKVKKTQREITNEFSEISILHLLCS